MAAESSNPLPPNEADCLAWVEGEPLPRDREQALARAMGADPALARRLQAMRADRQAIRELPPVSAPAGLMAGVEAALQPMLERQMLLGLQEGTSLSDQPPISIVRPVRRSIVAAFFADRVGRRLAAAAALLLVVGGATYMGTTYLSGRTAPKPTMISRNSMVSPRETQPGAREIVTGSPMLKSEPVRTIASAPQAPGTATLDKTADRSEPAATLASADHTESPDASEYGQWATGPFLPDLDGARAAELAREGRLLIRVTALDPSFRNGGVAERIRRADGNMIRLGEEAPPALVQILAPPPPSPEMGPAPASIAPALAADGAAPAPAYSEPAPTWTPPAEQTVYLVQVRLDGGALDALRGTLSGGYGEAQFEELSEPLQDGTKAINPASVIWWSQGPAAWKDWAGVPVVVDVNR